jgi:hypothetical protein
MASQEATMLLSVTKKYIKIKALEIQAQAANAQMERAKMSGGNEFLADAVRDELNWISSELTRLLDADEDGNLPTLKCPKCGKVYFDNLEDLNIINFICRECGWIISVRHPVQKGVVNDTAGRQAGAPEA